jgi:biotin carboxyl carrier protein
MKIQVKIGELTFDVEIGDITTRPVQASIGGELFEVWPEEPTAQHSPLAVTAPVVAAAQVSPKPAVQISQARAASPAGGVTAPMPGVIIAVTAHPGDLVKAGDELVVLEAMKMKNPIRATRAGTVCAILVNPGDHVKKGQPLVEFVG